MLKQKGKGKTVMEIISDNGLLNKDYPDINMNNNYSKETLSAFKILNSNSNSTNFVKGGNRKVLSKKSKTKKTITKKSKTKKSKMKKTIKK
jgi:hypothetical protein